MAAIVRPRFYPVFALVLGLVVFVAFARTLYLRHWFTVPPVDVATIIHGIVFTAWMILFIVQTRLIAAHNVRAHMRLGIAGVGLAALVFVFGLITVVASASASRPRPMGMASYQFVFVPFFIIVTFACLVTAAVLLRRHPQFHKRLMTLAMITVLPPATARLINLFLGPSEHFLVLQTSFTAAFVICCVVYDWFKNHLFHPVYAIGGGLLVLSWPFRAWFARTPAWESVGKWMASLSGG
jgi:hypothetical protein